MVSSNTSMLYALDYFCSVTLRERGEESELNVMHYDVKRTKISLEMPP